MAPKGRGLDLEYDTESRQSSHDTVPEPAMYETAYVTSHKANCRAGAFNAEGSLVATGSVDTSIKILDVDRMLAKSQIESMASGNKTIDPGSHPVIRTLYDHVEEVTCLRFHPREPLLASGSRDYTVKIFDYVRVHHMFSRILNFLFVIVSSRKSCLFYKKRTVLL